MEEWTEFRPPRLVVGLGNPGKQYVKTRHNVGFMIIDQIATDCSAKFVDEKRWNSQLVKDRQRYLLKPQTYMNESGLAVGQIASFYKIDAEEILVIYDDIDLSLGRIRIRSRGSAGGHRGVRSIISHLGTEYFPRLRVGIGRQDGGISNHVLGKFYPEERFELEKSIKDAVLAVGLIAEQGLPAAMTRFNASGEARKGNESRAKLTPPKNSSPETETSVEGKKKNAKNEEKL